MTLLRSCSFVFAITISFSAFSQDQLPQSNTQHDLTPLTLNDYRAIKEYADPKIRFYGEAQKGFAKDLKELATANPRYSQPRHWRFIPYGAAIGALVVSIPFIPLVILDPNPARYISNWMELMGFGPIAGGAMGLMIWHRQKHFSFSGGTWLNHGLEGQDRFIGFRPEDWLPNTPGFGILRFRFQTGDELLTLRDLNRFGVQFDHSQTLFEIIDSKFKDFQKKYVEPLDTRNDEHSEAEFQSQLMQLTALHLLYSELYRAAETLSIRASQRIKDLEQNDSECVKQIRGLSKSGK